MKNFILVAIVTVLLGLLTYGLWEMFYKNKENHCEMTYMFENPQYKKIKLPNDVKKVFPRYKLYYYTEGSRSLKYEGVPALFLPGNAGSYKQVRSAASVALRMAVSLGRPKIDFFVVDFDEQLSGFFGSFLFHQTEFARVCIEHILSLYLNSPTAHKNIFLIGHSMGGIVGRRLMRSLNTFNVPLLITQATPHQMPVISLDPLMVKAYEDEGEGDGVVVSVAGGDLDLHVRAGITLLRNNQSDVVLSSTNSMPKVWLSTDHLCHVWCKQVVMAVVRTLYDCIDKNNHIKNDVSEIRRAVEHHFVTHDGRVFYNDANKDTVDISMKCKVEEMPFKSYYSVGGNECIIIELNRMKNDDDLIAISNYANVAWVGLCSSIQASSCIQMKVVMSKLLPSSLDKYPFKVARIDKRLRSSHTHLMLYFPQKQSHLRVGVGSVGRDGVVLEAQPWSCILDACQVVTHEVHTKISLWGLGSTLQAFHLRVILLPPSEEAHATTAGCESVLQFEMTTLNHSVYTYAGDKQEGNMAIKVPLNTPSHTNILHLYTFPGCSYQISLQPHLSYAVVQFIKIYMPYLPAFVVAHLATRSLHLLRFFAPLLLLFPLKCFMSFTELSDVKDDVDRMVEAGVWNVVASLLLSMVACGVVGMDVCLLWLPRKIFGCLPSCSSLLSLRLLSVVVFISCIYATCLNTCNPAAFVVIIVVSLLKLLGGWQREVFWLLMLVQCVLWMPLFVVWIKDKTVFSLHEENSLPHLIVACVCVSVQLLRKSSRRTQESRISILLTTLFSTCTILYTPISLYRLPFFIDVALIYFSLPSFSSSSIPPASTDHQEYWPGTSSGVIQCDSFGRDINKKQL